MEIILTSLLLALVLLASLALWARRLLRRRIGELESALILEKKRLQGSATHQFRFLQRLSYEIRTPLNTIIGAARLASQQRDQYSTAEQLEHIRSASEELLASLDEMMLNLRAGDGAAPGFPVRFSLREELRGFYRSFAAEHEQRASSLRISDQLPDLFQDDVTSLVQLLANMADTMLHYGSEAAPLTIGVDLLHEQAETAVLCLAVTTHIRAGAGEEMQRLVLAPSTEDETQILSVVQRLVHSFDGSLKCHLEESTARLEASVLLERQIEQRHKAVLYAQDYSEHSLALGLHILLIEDDYLNQVVAVGILEQLGCTVEAVSSASDGLARFQCGSFDAVIVDKELPDLDGAQLAALLVDARKGAAGNSGATASTVPIIGLSAHVGKAEREACLQAGMDHFLSKPLEEQALREILAAIRPSTARVKRASNKFFIDTTGKPMC